MAQSFVESKELKKYPWFLQRILKSQKKKYGQSLIPTQYWGMIPRLFLLFTGFFKFFDRRGSRLDPALRSIVMVHVAQLNWCHFCVDLCSLLVIEKGGSQEKINALNNWSESSLISEREKSALAYAEAMTSSEKKVTSKERNSLKEHFSELEIIELTALIAFQNMSAKFNAALDIPAQGLCQFQGASSET